MEGCAAATLPSGALLLACKEKDARVVLDGELTQLFAAWPVLDAALADLDGSGLPQARPTCHVSTSTGTSGEARAWPRGWLPRPLKEG